MALAAMVTWAWLLGAAGKLGQLQILGWWERRFRQANWADMTAYVGIKNILIASLLFFISAHDSGLGPLLQGLPEMGWHNAVP